MRAPSVTGPATYVASPCTGGTSAQTRLTRPTASCWSTNWHCTAPSRATICPNAGPVAGTSRARARKDCARSGVSSVPPRSSASLQVHPSRGLPSMATTARCADPICSRNLAFSTITTAGAAAVNASANWSGGSVGSMATDGAPCATAANSATASSGRSDETITT